MCLSNIKNVPGVTIRPDGSSGKDTSGVQPSSVQGLISKLAIGQTGPKPTTSIPQTGPKPTSSIGQTSPKPTTSQEDSEEQRKRGRWVLKPKIEILGSGKDQTISMNTESGRDGGGTTPNPGVVFSTKKNKESDEDVLMDELKDGRLEEEEEKTEVGASGDGKESKKLPMSLSGNLRAIGKKP